MTSYRFFRHKNGVSSFASISLCIVEGSDDSVVWADELAPLEKIYGSGVWLGIKDALIWHAAAGGHSVGFRVLDFTELVVDTRVDAARCASTVAAWKALGNDEADLYFCFGDHWAVGCLAAHSDPSRRSRAGTCANVRIVEEE